MYRLREYQHQRYPQQQEPSNHWMQNPQQNQHQQNTPINQNLIPGAQN